MLIPLLLSLLCSGLLKAGVADELSSQLRESGLDPGECYRVRDLRFVRDEIKLYFTDGHLIFGKPVNGRRMTAVFSADTEGGDAELLLLPPFERERRSLAAFAKSPNLNEHFRLSAMVFTDDTAAELLRMISESQARKSPEMGALLSSQWGDMVKSFLGSFEVRMVEDLLAPRQKDTGFFFAAIGGNTLGNFDVIWDPRARQQILLGQLTFREERRFFDTWTNFEGLAWRKGQRKFTDNSIRVDQVRIQAAIESDLSMRATSKLHVIPAQAERSLGFEISHRMQVREVKIDGQPAEWFSPDSLRANLLRSSENQSLLIIAPHELPAGKPVEVEIRHEGTVILRGGDRIYYVGSRAAWFPIRPRQFAFYDVTFRYPKELDLVATGDIITEQVEGDWKISHHKTSSPARLFGFNLGEYERTKVSRGGLTVEVCANRRFERAIQPRPRVMDVTPLPPQPFPQRGPRRTPEVVVVPTPAPTPVSRLQPLATDIASIFDELSTRFGKPPLKHLAVSPIPGRFGQGFPGLVYLSTLAYLDPKEMPVDRTNPGEQVFFADLLHAHEVAHQWWGNGVTSADYQDEWLMEALANYSALWMLERKKGPRAVDTVLDQYRDHLLKKIEDDRTVESTGPVTMGHRLFSSQSPNAWAVITYEKGAWILHMLRRRLGDDGFQKMLSQLYQRYLNKPISTTEFQTLASQFLPPGSPDSKLETFFDYWVNGTGVPSLKLKWAVTGRAPKVTLTGTLTQSDVDENFGTWVPVEVQVARLKPQIKWVRTADEPVTFTMSLAAPPAKVTLDPGNAVLMRR